MAVDTTPALREQLERGLTLPASWYSDPEVLRLEQKLIFGCTWQYAGSLTQLQGRAAPAARVSDEDQLEIPAFLRRQAN